MQFIPTFMLILIVISESTDHKALGVRCLHTICTIISKFCMCSFNSVILVLQFQVVFFLFFLFFFF